MMNRLIVGDRMFIKIELNNSSIKSLESINNFFSIISLDYKNIIHEKVK